MFEKHIKKYGSRNIENITNTNWGEPNYDSYLVKTCHQLVKKQLNRFTVEDLRIMIGQEIETEYLVLFALIQLEKNILAEGDLYPGDLLSNLLAVPSSFWKKHIEYTQVLNDLVTNNKSLLFENDIDYKPFLKRTKK